MRPSALCPVSWKYVKGRTVPKLRPASESDHRSVDWWVATQLASSDGRAAASDGLAAAVVGAGSVTAAPPAGSSAARSCAVGAAFEGAAGAPAAAPVIGGASWPATRAVVGAIRRPSNTTTRTHRMGQYLRARQNLATYARACPRPAAEP